ncbi:ATP-binding protein [Actinomadura scrupuli]|uniref:ATP-binding protein n=1 Tax=Actinomadura scrupuli TaxID=559629 RepID=UPI003D99C694
MKWATTAIEPPRMRRVIWSLMCDPVSVPQARHLIREQLADWGLSEQSDAVELLASELVTNALRHAWGNPTLILSVQDGALRCTVKDESPALPHLSNADPDEVGGLGLHLVDRLSSSWGSNPVSQGKIVWFEMRT